MENLIVFTTRYKCVFLLIFFSAAIDLAFAALPSAASPPTTSQQTCPNAHQEAVSAPLFGFLTIAASPTST